ncbi:MAG: hypothetical protein ACI4P3_04770 [Candidatus Spyradosoma sp.]
MKNSNPRCVPAILKTAALAAILAVPAAPAFAQEYASAEEIPFFENENASWKTAFAVNAFYAKAQEYSFGDEWEKTDLYGMDFRMSWENDKAFSKESRLMPEIYALGSVAFGGESDITTLLQLAAGANVHWRVSESFSLFAGGRFGLGWTTLSEPDNGDGGLLYGIGCGCVFKLTRNSSITVGIDYVHLDANPSKDFHGYEIESPEPEYLMFSLGYKISL